MGVHGLERTPSGEQQPNSWQELNRPRADRGGDVPPPPCADDAVLLDIARVGSPFREFATGAPGNRDPIKLLLAGSIGFVAVVSVAMLASGSNSAAEPSLASTSATSASPSLVGAEPTPALAFDSSEPTIPELLDPVRDLGMAVHLLDQEQQQVLRLYLTAFGRVPDHEGFAFWTDERRRSVPLASIAESFVATQEFRSVFEPMTERERVEALYVNVLGRVGDEAGLDFWTSQLEAEVPIHELVVAFAESAESRTATGSG